MRPAPVVWMRQAAIRTNTSTVVLEGGARGEDPPGGGRRFSPGPSALHEVLHVKARFKQLGGETLPGSRFSPDRKDFNPILDDLARQIAQARSTRKNAKVAVYFAGGDEIVPILKAAAKRPELTGVMWYGCDSTGMVASRPMASP